MSIFLDTTGNTTLGIAICGRCSRKFPLGDLRPDPNYPNLMVCVDDLDDFDPYRLAARPEDNIILPFVRPDLPLVVPAEPATPGVLFDPGLRITEPGNLRATEDGEGRSTE